MILQALKEYYDRKAQDPESGIATRGWEIKEIPFIIVLDDTGNLHQIEDTREMVNKNNRARAFSVPQAVKKAFGIAANLLWDTAGYVFGLDTKDKPQRAQKQKMAFRERLEKELGEFEAIKTILQFLDNFTLEQLQQHPLWAEIAETNPNLTFRFVNNPHLACHIHEIESKISSLAITAGDSETNGTCLVTGNSEPISALHTALKGVRGAQSFGANIVSFNLDAFSSYNKKQGYNAPVGATSVFAYTTALNNLLAKDSEQKIVVGDTTTVFWSRTASLFEMDFAAFFSEPAKSDPDAGCRKVKALFDSAASGAYMDDDATERFHVLGLAPNAARISIRFWFNSTIRAFADRLREHFSDLAIAKPSKEPEHYSLWRLLVNVAVQDKSENIPPNLAGAFMRAILGGSAYPATLLQAALRRIASDVEGRVKPVRAALIKAYLNRYHRIYPSSNHKELLMSLDPQQPSKGYQLGRLFAVLEKIQEEASHGVNAGIRERYYGAACATPVTVFANLMRLKNHHLAKIDNKGRVVNLERLIAEIVAHLPDFPAHLNLHEQGRFAIGYYHQRQHFFTKNAETPATA